jgi:hypothetical protein
MSAHFGIAPVKIQPSKLQAGRMCGPLRIFPQCPEGIENLVLQNMWIRTDETEAATRPQTAPRLPRQAFRKNGRKGASRYGEPATDDDAKKGLPESGQLKRTFA